MKAWRVHRPANPLRALELDEIPAPQPGPGQVRIAVTRSVLNFNDIDGCYGRYRTVAPPLPYTAGMEVVGTVESAGAGAEDWIGRRVMACPDGAYGGYADFAVAPLDMTFEAPPGASDDEAAAFFFPFHLAYLALHERGRLQRGESVLIHAAAGGIGSAAVQLAHAAGAQVIATAGSPEKLRLCKELGADRAIDYRAGDFADEVLDATGGDGVDVIFDTLGGEVTQSSFRCIARNGRHLMVGFSTGIEAEDSGLTPRPVIFGNFALLGVILAYTSAPREVKRASGFNLVPRAVGDAIHKNLVAMLEAGEIHPVIGRRVPFEEVPQALEDLEQRRTTGRSVVVF
jgi:NADPH2:quinone reductase